MDRFLSADAELLESGLFSDVTVTCGSKTWNLHKNILCTRSSWFKKALTGNFEESKTGRVDIKNFEPEAVEWLIRYIYTGVCDISALRPNTKTNFVICYEVYTVADYFAMDPLVKIALDTLNAEMQTKLGPIQLLHEPSDWLDELFEAIKLVYEDTHPGDTTPMTQIRSAFLNFVHAARFYFLQNGAFARFLDEEAPVLAIDMFRAMRTTGDFIVYQPDPQCNTCKNRPSRGDKGYYTHLVTDMPRLLVCCSTCAVKKDLPPPTENWSGKGIAR
ncbi:BTB/POZ protein [Cercophora scortea]|uniref:BTB/POZ protein n=1 Tax=Cercophora scortea TaxID=314031 RepID=A0AAE0I845_9PEZI|nr:BTB/POZ protein [Cercophora scortea]